MAKIPIGRGTGLSTWSKFAKFERGAESQIILCLPFVFLVVYFLTSVCEEAQRVREET